MRQLAIAVATLMAAVAVAQQAPAPATAAPPPAARRTRSQFLLTVTDENGDAVRQARITLVRPGTPVAWVGATDYRGLAALPIGSGGIFHLRVDKEGYYAADLQQSLQPGASLDLSMHHVQEYRETVQVSDSVPGVDPARISETHQLTNREIFSLPYPTTRDYRNVLPFLPGVVQQPNGDINVAGSAAFELFATLDGFDMTNPSGSPLEMRLSPDVLRRIDLQESRYSPQFGKGAGGVLQLESNMGDDHFRFTATNFVPGINLRGGITPETFDPRLTFSGPIAKGRAWFIDGLSGEYDWNIDRDLPKPIQDNPAWRVDNLAKVQVNLAPNNILTGSFLVNHGKSERVGLSLFTPPESTFDQHINNYLADIKDSIYLGSHTLLEAGFGYSDIFFDQLPRGDLPFVQTPSTVSGSFFQTTSSDTRRYQAFSNLYLPPRHWHGRHEFLVGVDLERINHDRFLLRRPIDILREDGTLSQFVTFSGPPRFGVNNTEGAVFAQDRWSASDRLLIEYGARGDWDQVIRNPVASPRAAATYLLPHTEATKLSVGVGLVYDRTNLNFIELPLIGQRFDQLFAADGVTPVGAPLVTIFSANTRALEMPRYLNWSIGLERMIGKWYAKVNYLQKRGSHGFAFINQSPQTSSLPPNGLYDLESVAQPKYDAVEFTVRRTFAVNHEFFLSYTRSDARSNAVVDFTTTTLFAQQAGGPLPWDAPNRIVSWGWLPIAKKWDFAYSTEWRTGFPFSAVNQLQELVGFPDQFRFPDFFTLNVHVEYRFRFHGYEWAVRGGFNNVTGRRNPAFVNNNVDSPDFLTFSSFQHRVFTGRIRLLGRK